MQEQRIDPIAIGNQALKDINLNAINLVKLLEELLRQNIILQQQLAKFQGAAEKKQFNEYDANIETV